MSKRTRKHLEAAKNHLVHSVRQAEAGSFAHRLEVTSLRSHIDELETYEAIEAVGRTHELIDFRMIADTFRSGTVPLKIIASAAEEIRKMVGYSALRFTQGGRSRKRVPADLYDELDLRLAGVLPGSSRLLVAAAAHRDLFDDGVAKHAIDRIMGVLETKGRGKEFLESVADLGPQGAKSLREFLKILRANSGALEMTWSFSGSDIRTWSADVQDVIDVTAALERTVLREQANQLLNGKIELLSKRERIQLRAESGEVYRVLYPKRLLPQVTELHLDQEVSLYCQVTMSENPLTNEFSHHYELLEVRSY
jgi:hypothetical protein